MGAFGAATVGARGAVGATGADGAIGEGGVRGFTTGAFGATTGVALWGV